MKPWAVERKEGGEECRREEEDHPVGEDDIGYGETMTARKWPLSIFAEENGNVALPALTSPSANSINNVERATKYGMGISQHAESGVKYSGQSIIISKKFISGDGRNLGRHSKIWSAK